MKTKLLLFVLSLFLTVDFLSFAQLTGIKNIPGDYATFALAIADLNTKGVGNGGVTLNLLAGNPQTAPIGGYSITTLTGTQANPIILQGNGNTITAYSPQVIGGRLDAIIKLVGADYVTINNFILNENSSNNTFVNTNPATNNMTEFGIALFYANIFNGTQNNIITNCVVDLNETYIFSYAIYSNANHSATSITSASSTTLAGANTGLSIIGNNLTSNIGVFIVGSESSIYYQFYNLIINNNTIINFGAGGGSASNNLPSVNYSTGVGGIKLCNTGFSDISNNNISSISTGARGIIAAGIIVEKFLDLNKSFTISNNNISVSEVSAVAQIIKGIYITDSQPDSIKINNNTFTNFGYIGSLRNNSISFIELDENIYSLENLQIKNNVFSGNSVNTTGNVFFISINPGSIMVDVSNNVVNGFSKTGSGGTVRFINRVSPNEKYGYYVNNSISNFNISGITTAELLCIPGTSSILDSTLLISIYNNTVNTVSAGSGKVRVFYLANITSDVYNNSISNITGAGEVNGMEILGTNPDIDIYSNNLSAISSTAGAVNGINLSNYYGLSVISKNNIFNLSSLGAAAEVNGIKAEGTTNESDVIKPVITVSQNKIYNLSASNPGVIVSGIRIKEITFYDYTFNANNNIIGDLRAPAATGLNAINGMLLEDNGIYNINYNTIYLNAVSSSATTFGTSCITLNNLSTTFSLNNNILINLSTPAQNALNNSANGISACVRLKSGISGTVPSSYSLISNNNDYWVNPSAGTNNHLTYLEGSTSITNPKNTVADLITFLIGGESYSFAENPSFISTDGTNTNYLHINNSIPTELEGNGNNVSSILYDFDGDARALQFTDVGADEFNGTSIDITPPIISYTPFIATGSISNRNFTANISDASGIDVNTGKAPRVYFKRTSDVNTFNDNTSNTVGWKFTESNTGSSPFSFTIDYSLLNGGTGATQLDTIQYFVVAQDLSVNHLVGVNTGILFAVNPDTIAFTSTSFPVSGSISKYNITNLSLNGNYTVGAAMFNSISGRNITFEQVTYKSLKEVLLIQGSDKDSLNNNEKAATKFVEVEETKWIPIENGADYKGDLYIKKSENPDLFFPEGINGVYATLTAAVNDLNLRGVSGPTTFLLTDATYTTETFPITIKITNSNVTTALNNVTIKPASDISATISGSSVNAIIKLGGADFITIDGSNSGGNDRNLTIINNFFATSQYYYVPVIWVASLGVGNGAVNNTIKNCVIKSRNDLYDGVRYCGIFSGSNVRSVDYPYYLSDVSYGVDNDNLTIINNLISSTKVAISIIGSPNGINDNIIITDNIIGSDVETEKVRWGGIKVANCNNLNISKNRIFNLYTTPQPDGNGYFYDIYGIQINNTVNGVINNNFISKLGSYFKLEDYPTTIYAPATADGIIINTGSLISNITIANNVIADFTTTRLPNVDYGYIELNAGIRIMGYTGGLNIYFNTINLTGRFSLTSHIAEAAGIYISSQSNNLDIRNNIFSNTIENKGNTISRSYGIYAANSSLSGSTINFNNYFVTGLQGVLAHLNGINYLTLGEWQSASGKDANSIFSDPLFSSQTNPVPKSTSSVFNTGTPIVGITQDIIGTTRSLTPTIGAYELGVNTGPAITYPKISDTMGKANQILNSVLITDNDNIANGLYNPRVYWKVNNGSWQSLASPSLHTPYDFTIGTTNLSDNDTIFYFITAQDLLGTVSSNPAENLDALDVNNILVYPSNPNFYVILANPNYGGGKPENGGYFFANSTPGAINSPDQPVYQWIDPIANNHTLIPYWSSNYSDDVYYRIMSLPFNFSFFGNLFPQVIITTDGFIGFDAGEIESNYNPSSYNGQKFPTYVSPLNVIAGFWCFSLLEANRIDYLNSGVYYYGTNYGNINDYYVVTYYHNYFNFSEYPWLNENYITFQIILKANGNIKIQFNDAESNFPASFNDYIVGIQSGELYNEILDLYYTAGVSYKFLNSPNGGPIFSSPLAIEFGMDASNLPIELSTFTAKSNQGNILLNWETKTEINAFSFDVERMNKDNTDWEKIGSVTASGNSNSIKSYSFTDKKPISNKSSYRLKMIDNDGTFAYSQVVETEIGLPDKFELSQNFPNPFNPTTKIRYSIPLTASANVDVSLKVYDILGSEVATIVNEQQAPGYYEIEFSTGIGLASGVYIYRLHAGDFVSTKKMMILK